MSADELAAALGGRRTGRGWRAPCPGHDDRHPSLDIIEAADGKPLFVDRSGRCSQTEILEALKARGLWQTSSRQIRRTPAFRWAEHLTADEPAISDCCLAGGCDHWRKFDVEFTTARLTGYLVDAAAEMIDLFKVAQMKLGADELRAELDLIVEWNPEKQMIEQYLDAEQVRELVDAVVRGLMCFLGLSAEQAKQKIRTLQDAKPFDPFSDSTIDVAAALKHLEPATYERLANNLKSSGQVSGISRWREAVWATERNEIAKLREAEQEARAAARAGRNASGPAQWAPRDMAPQAVNGADLVVELTSTILTFVSMSYSDAMLVAIWILFTHVFEAAETNPFLRIISPAPNCGKSTLMKLIFRLVRSGWLVSRSTQSAYYRKLQKAKYTIGLDEGDAFLAENEIWRNILDGASDPDTATISLSVKDGDDWVQTDIDIYAPIAIASIEKLKRMRTVESRSIAVQMKRATAAERKQLTKARRRTMKPLLLALAQKCARWGADNITAFAAARPVMPEYMDGREQDKLEPVFAIAEMASPAILTLIRTLVIRRSEDDDASDEYSALILPDIKQIFEADNLDRILQKDLCAKLAEIEGQPWGEYGEYGRSRKPITSRQLAVLLKPYTIVSHSIEITESKVRGLGYYRTDFYDAFARYVPICPDLNREHVRPQRGEGPNGDFAAVNEEPLHSNENASKPNGENGIHGFTAENSDYEAMREKTHSQSATEPASDADGAETDRLARADGWDGDPGNDEEGL